MNPSLYLVKDLINTNTGLNAQIKIAYDEEPILSVYKLILTYLLDKEDISNQICFVINGYLHYLKLDTKVSSKDLEKFKSSYKLYGTFQAYMSFLYELGIAQANYQNNLETIEKFQIIHQDNISEIWNELDQLGGKKFSWELHTSGEGLIKIMSSHASKGLEFDIVILGGVHTNGRTLADKSSVGKFPASLRWKPDLTSKKALKSPSYIIENSISKKKEFSESKRLLYVACTRAKKVLAWPDIDNLIFSKNSWIKPLREIAFSSEFAQKRKLEFKDNKEGKEVVKPFYQSNNLGINEVSKSSGKLLFLPELSVTALAAISECPRKFYLKNICKLDSESLEVLNIETGFKNYTSSSKSNSNRGTLLHEEISFGLKNNFVISRNFSSDAEKRDLEAVEWAIKEVQNLAGDTKLYSEHEIKFSFFGHMISGTPDLFFIKNGANIVDFKSGTFKNESDAYWFQLKCYAFGLFELGLIDKTDQASLILSFIDEKKALEKRLNFDELEKEMNHYFLQLNNSDKINQEHCSECLYQSICHN